MKRQVEIENCTCCPFFYEVKEYALHYVGCKAIGRYSKPIFVGKNDEYVRDQLNDWFNNICKLKEIKE